MKESIKNITCILAVFVLSACSKETKDTTTDKFIDVYSDMLIISANKTLTDSIRKQQIDSLLTANNYTDHEFQQITNQNAKDPVKWKDIYKEIVEKIDAKKKQPVKQVVSTSDQLQPQ